ncbi:hypothetical protein pETSU_117 [Edwardsiella phage pEt-SU]|uniref:Uncharacterized protein n=1 Tax=Edwardsiella phage pEt-SU TaxID=2562142 RepID=A0A4D6DWU8_9CAUD|nr:hypothetical protein HOV39_gp117 [Edwardsiella phage pEt-SU]QBZ70698.1 hypothetical protein pETSU_117 [Edwardsiella phage pEt-SU]
MKKTIDLTNVCRLRRNLNQAMSEMRTDDVLALTEELEKAAQLACYEITGLEHICVPTTWNEFLETLEERNSTETAIRGNERNVQSIGRLRSSAVEPAIVQYTGRKRHPMDTIIDPEVDTFLAEQHIIGATKYLSREVMISQLGMWQIQCNSLKLVAQALIFAKEIERLESMSDEVYDALDKKENPDVINAVVYLSKVHAKNARAADLKGVVQIDIPESEMPQDIYGKPADVQIGFSGITTKPGNGIPLLRDGCKNEKYHDKPLMGSYLTPPTQPQSTAQINAEKEMFQTFCTILSKEMADRLARDLEHLINITDDAEYAEAISQEVRRIRLFAEGRIKTLSDVNFAWVYHGE